MSRPHSLQWRASAATAAVALWSTALVGTSCAAPQRPASASCSVPQSVHLEVDASDRLNLDDHGRSLPTIVRIYQLKNISRLEAAEFQDVWQRAHDTLGEDLVDMVEVTVYPHRQVSRSFVRNPEAMYVAAVAIVRHPAGISWRSVYELGPSPGASRCAAQQRDPTASPNPPPDPRFFFFVEDYRIEGRDSPPEAPVRAGGADGGATGPALPAAPQATPPAAPGGLTLRRQTAPGTTRGDVAGLAAPASRRPRDAEDRVLCPHATGAAWVRQRRAEAET